MALTLSACSLLAPTPDEADLATRMAAFPTTGLPLRRPVTIYWHARQIPFIEAEDDADAAFALGLVHAHLRLGQMTLLRHLARGRLAELAGPAAVDLDHALRLIDFGRAAPATLARMATPARTWLDSFVAGLNHSQAAQAAADTMPYEFSLFDLTPEPWTPEDIITIGRLASTDVTWLVWFRLMALRDDPEWPKLWPRLIEAGTTSAPSFARPGSAALAPLETALTMAARLGSNAMAVHRTRTGGSGALFGADTHLGLALPNLWLVAGLKSPSYHMAGLMVPGLPFVAVGRNPEIAWGGTNLRAAASDLFDVSALPVDRMTTRRETIRVRWWFDREIELRDTPLGPIISDAPQIKGRPGEAIALKWLGHQPSDELGAMLAVNRARSFTEFRDALAEFALSPQNFLYADRQGNIGQVTATQLPQRSRRLPADLVRPLADARAWDRMITARDLPWVSNPAKGVLASANNRPAAASVLIGYFFSADDRIERLEALLGQDQRLTLDDLATIQQDVVQPSSLALRAAALGRMAAPGLAAAMAEIERRPEQRAALDVLRGWDGRYAVDSKGAVAFEGFAAALGESLLPEPTRRAEQAIGRPFALLREALDAATDERLAQLLPETVRAAADAVARYPAWGDVHRLSLSHSLGLLPMIGSRFRYGDRPTPGSRETVWKSGHEAGISEPHQVRFGANARFLGDLSTLDDNRVVLLGGQDGWLNSETFADQVDLWLAGRYVPLPLSLAAVRQQFTLRLALVPGAAPGPVVKH